MIGFAKDFGFKDAEESAIRVREQVDDGLMIRNAPCTIEVLCDLMQDLDGSLRKAIFKKKLVFLENAKEKFLNKSDLFSKAVYETIPESAYDIHAAGNCLAFDLNTAAVFHLMRVAEIGLRCLAGEVGVKLGCAIEYATWGEVLSAIDDKLKLIKNTTPRGDPREGELQFYTQLSQEIRSFNYAWRDPIMHARTRFDDPLQAENIYNHVRRFMDVLAAKMKK
jgi:hypothetical protein